MMVALLVQLKTMPITITRSSDPNYHHTRMIDGNQIAFFHFKSPLSNHFPADFKLSSGDITDTFSCTEQRLFQQRALICGEDAIAQQIMDLKRGGDIKRISHKIKVDETKWTRKVEEDVIYEAMYAKFSQNARLRDYLVGTGDAVLIEGCTDTRWGGGVSMNNIDGNTKFSGENLCGVTLMKVRAALN